MVILTFARRSLSSSPRTATSATAHTSFFSPSFSGSSSSWPVAAVAAAAALAFVASSASSDPEKKKLGASRLDAGYRSLTDVDLAVVRKLKGLAPVQGESIFTEEEVAEHNGDATDKGESKRLWVTYKDGVYDVTDFAHVHPGGVRFLNLAGGGPVDAWWAYWHWHHASPHVEAYLKQHRIGRLAEWDQADDPTEGVDLYQHDPPRPSHQPALFDRPWSSQCAPAYLAKQYLTPSDAFYVRNHAPVPLGVTANDEICFHVINAESSLEGASSLRSPGKKACVDTADFEKHTALLGSASLADLEKRFGFKTVTSVLQCGGSRAREDLALHGPSGFTGNNFESITCGMLGNAQWGGVPLAKVVKGMYPKEVLDKATAVRGDKAKEEAQGGSSSSSSGSSSGGGGGSYHLEFHGEDGYYASIPLARVLDEGSDCLLCTQMNGEPLTRDHGSPVRVILPGIVGARNVKWLKRIVLRHDEGLGPWNNHYYNAKDLPKDEHGSYQSGHTLELQSVILGAALRSQSLRRSEAEVSGKPLGESSKESAGGGGKEEPGSSAHSSSAVFVDVQGVAYSGGDGAEVAKVEVSVDLGSTWHAVDLNRREVLKDDSSKAWHWLRWTATVAVPGASVRTINQPNDSTSAEKKNRAGEAAAKATAGQAAVERRHVVRNKRRDPADLRTTVSAPRDDVNVPSLALLSVQARAFVKTARPPAFARPSEAPQVWCRAFTDKGGVQLEVSPWRGGYNFNGYHKVHIEPAGSE